jgi:uncharacterized ferredoxin-like protein
MSSRDEWAGRAVVCSEFDIKRGRIVRAAFREGDGETGSYACLVASLRYADTNELVFQSVDEVEAQPFRLQQRILYLAGQAARVNGMLDDDAPATGSPNGSAEAAGPSH